MGSTRASEASECRPRLVLVASCGGNVGGGSEGMGSTRASGASECRPRVRAHVPRTRARRIPFYIGVLGGFIVYYLV